MSATGKTIKSKLQESLFAPVEDSTPIEVVLQVSKIRMWVKKAEQCNKRGN